MAANLRVRPEKLQDEMPVVWIEAIEAHGWASAGSNQSYVFFEKPGYWLRLFRFDNGWEASVTPEYFKSSPDPASPFERYAEAEMAPSFTGKGARARALAHAKALWKEHAAYLSPLGVTSLGPKGPSFSQPPAKAVT